jgi:hypothetical protein
MTMLRGKRAQPRFIHDLHYPPEWVGKVKLVEPYVFRHDTMRAVDVMIDSELVAITMLDVCWEFPPPSSVEEGGGGEGELEPCLHTIYAKHPKDGLAFCRGAGFDRVKTLVVSERGSYTLIPRHHHMIRWKTAHPPHYQAGQLSTLTETTARAYVIEGRPITSETLFSCTERAGSCTYPELLRINPDKTQYDHIILIGHRHTSIRWKRQAVHLMRNRPNSCTFIYVGPSPSSLSSTEETPSSMTMDHN